MRSTTTKPPHFKTPTYLPAPSKFDDIHQQQNTQATAIEDKN
jgi:hypothetical protein